MSSTSSTETTPLKSIFLLADSELLFYRANGQLLLDRVVKESKRNQLKAAYVGASNGDHPDFYAIFVAAMEGAGIYNCRMIPSRFSGADLAFLNDADVILLAGGDPEAGWRVFLANGLDKHIVRRYSEGASLIGISAGAVQLGLCCRAADGSLIETFALAPFVIGAHEEADNWKTTVELLQLSGSRKPAIGLPKGGGAVYHPDHTLESLRYPFVELFAYPQITQID
ncbi:MAG TPA: Type 1 glutamine amidotransferase-like domain-containing protein [Pyrinomonadaceae bacterium]|nr:Type 1 glutamine amidotransferase-like domain-containing protein [Pyrinomonadaceae bacterium]